MTLPPAQGSEEFSSDNFLDVEVQSYYLILGKLVGTLPLIAALSSVRLSLASLAGSLGFDQEVRNTGQGLALQFLSPTSDLDP